MSIFTTSVSWTLSSISTRQELKLLKTVLIALYLHSVQVYSIVDEMFLAGELRETSQTKVLKQLLMLNSLE